MANSNPSVILGSRSGPGIQEQNPALDDPLDPGRASRAQDDVARIAAVLSNVPDPEIPAVSVLDLGIVREITDDHVTITPTYTGCPATIAIERMIREALDANGMEASAIDWLIPHQANIRIMDATAKKLGLPLSKVIATVDRHGNTSAASIPLALDVAVRDGRIQPGHHVMMVGVGGGFTWGSVFLRW